MGDGTRIGSERFFGGDNFARFEHAERAVTESEVVIDGDAVEGNVGAGALGSPVAVNEGLVFAGIDDGAARDRGDIARFGAAKHHEVATAGEAPLDLVEDDLGKFVADEGGNGLGEGEFGMTADQVFEIRAAFAGK